VKKIRIETLIVVAVLAVTIIADTLDLATNAWDWLKVVKIIAAVVGLVITWKQLTRSSPYHKDLLSSSDWTSVAVGEFEIQVSHRVHGRGDTPQVRCLVPDGAGWAECFTDAQVDGKGNVKVTVTSPDTMRIEIRA
jgi:hypothetical protein